jgi:carboxylesterase type B
VLTTHQVPLLTSKNRYEGFYFTNNSLQTENDVTTDLQVIFPKADRQFFHTLFKLYPRSDYNSTFYQRVEIFGDFTIKCPTMWLMEAVQKKSNGNYKLVFNAGHQQHAATNDFIFDISYDCEYNSSDEGNEKLMVFSETQCQYHAVKVHAGLVFVLRDILRSQSTVMARKLVPQKAHLANVRCGAELDGGQ